MTTVVVAHTAVRNEGNNGVFKCISPSALVPLPIITIKANIDATVKEIRGALTDTQVQIFKKTCFGHWLDISLKRNNQLLIHTLLTCMVDSVANELSFLVSGKRIRFRRQEFCLVTGLRFGSNMYMKEWVKNMAENSFRNRIFPDIEARSVKLSDIWILEVIPATHVYVSKEPMEKIPRAFAWKMILPFSWARCRTLFVGDNLAPPLETLTPTKAESESDWWKTSLEYFEGKGVQSEAVSEQLEIEKDSLSEEVQKKKKRKRGSSPPSFQNPTYEQLMTRVSTLEGTVTTLTQTVSSLQGSIGTLESRLLALEDTHLDDSDAAKDIHLDVVTTISVPMTTTEKTLKDIIHIDASDPTQETGHIHTEDELKIIRIETTTKKPSYDLPDLTKIRRCKYPIFTTFEKKKTDCYLDCLPKMALMLYDTRLSINGTLDCGVMACKFIEMLTKGKTINAKSFGAKVPKKCQEFRAKRLNQKPETSAEMTVFQQKWLTISRNEVLDILSAEMKYLIYYQQK
ncbi:hypothetical protein Tco_0470968 [Tanacetum coccineum]